MNLYLRANLFIYIFLNFFIYVKYSFEILHRFRLRQCAFGVVWIRASPTKHRRVAWASSSMCAGTWCALWAIR